MFDGEGPRTRARIPPTVATPLQEVGNSRTLTPVIENRRWSGTRVGSIPARKNDSTHSAGHERPSYPATRAPSA